MVNFVIWLDQRLLKHQYIMPVVRFISAELFHYYIYIYIYI